MIKIIIFKNVAAAGFRTPNLGVHETNFPASYPFDHTDCADLGKENMSIYVRQAALGTLFNTLHLFQLEGTLFYAV